jgi:hypothetical protein
MPGSAGDDINGRTSAASAGMRRSGLGLSKGNGKTKDTRSAWMGESRKMFHLAAGRLSCSERG